MFVDLGAATNSCQVENRMPNSPRNQPCTELETRAGTRLYEANKILQHFSPAERYATGLRNGERFAFDVSGRLFVTQHGRDQLSQNWSKFYTSEQSARQPAEEIVLLERGAYLRLAGVLLRPLSAKARAGARIWRRCRQGGWRLRQENCSRRGFAGALGAKRYVDLATSSQRPTRGDAFVRSRQV
jgi:hypothetical protein